MKRVVHPFAQRVSQAKLGPDLQVTYRVVGGMPSQRVNYEVNVDSVSGATVAVSDARLSPTTKRASIAPEQLDVRGLFKQISAGVQSLVPASRASSAPDAAVGSITIRVGNDEETFYFVPEAEKRRTPGKGVAPSMERALQRFWGIAKDVAEAKGVTEGHEGAKSE
jgi:hypothetical protein